MRRDFEAEAKRRKLTAKSQIDPVPNFVSWFSGAAPFTIFVKGAGFPLFSNPLPRGTRNDL